MEVIEAGLEGESPERLLCFIVIFVEKYEKHIEDGVLEVGPGLDDGVLFLQSNVGIPVLFGFHWESFFI